MVLQKDDQNSVDCEENESKSVADGGGDSRDSWASWVICSEERFGKELTAWHGEEEKRERTTEE